MSNGQIRPDLVQQVNALVNIVKNSGEIKKDQKQNILSALEDVKGGKKLSDALGGLGNDERKKLANTIARIAEPPDELKGDMTTKSGKAGGGFSKGREDDCALRQVENAEKDGTKFGGGQGGFNKKGAGGLQAVA